MALFCHIGIFTNVTETILHDPDMIDFSLITILFPNVFVMAKNP